MTAKLYWFPISHPSQAARKMLELKGVDYRLVTVLPGNQKVHMRLAGFRGGTVPGLKLDGRRIQGSCQIARALDELQPDPPLFPADPEARRAIEEVERWGDEEFQPVPRRILRFAMRRDVGLRAWLAGQSLPLPGVAARLTGPVSWYYARDASADEEHARRDVGSLPALLERIDALLADGTLSLDRPNAATFQILCTVRSLDGFTDFQDLVRAHPAGEAALRLFPEDFSDSLVPPCVPRDWLPAG